MPYEQELLGYRARIARQARRPARISSLVCFAAGFLNLASVAIPAGMNRLGPLRHIVPGEVSTTAAVVVGASGIGLLLLAGGLRRRNRAAWLMTTMLLFLSAIAHVLKGLDLEEALTNMFLAGALAASGHYFIGGDLNRSRLQTAVFGALLSVGGAFAIGLIAIMLAGHEIGFISAVSHCVQMITTGSTTAQIPRHTHRFLPVAVQVVLFGGLLFTAAELFAPTRKQRSNPAPEALAMNSDDSLAWFSTREDRQTLGVRNSAISFGQSGSVALAAGDPLGEVRDWPDAISSYLDYCAKHGRVAAVLACGERARDLYRRFEMHSLYLGDEAILDLNSFTIDGGKMKTVRGSWKRVQRAGFTSDVKRVADLTDVEKSELEAVSEKWRGEELERGFSMSLGRLFGEIDGAAVVVLARDDQGAIRGFLHLVPWGSEGVSLDVMRRDREAIAVLNDYLVVEAATKLRELGINKMSLNFSALRSVLVAGAQDNATPLLRLQRRVLLTLSGSFQIETLYRFNKKFNPQWQPRYAMVEFREDAPRVLYSALKLEGLLPTLKELRKLSGGEPTEDAHEVSTKSTDNAKNTVETEQVGSVDN